MIQTVAGNLGCKAIFHTPLTNYNPSSGFADITSRVKECLKLLVAGGFESIAFTSMGTGGLNYPHQVSSGAMVDAVVKFVKFNSNIPKRISFVLLPNDFEASQGL